MLLRIQPAKAGFATPAGGFNPWELHQGILDSKKTFIGSSSLDAVVKKGFSVETRGFRSMRQAFQDRDLDKVQHHLRRGTHIDVRSLGGATSLHWCATNNYSEGAEFLANHGAELEARDNMGRTPLHSASYADHVAVATLLLQKEADPNGRDKCGNRPLHLATSSEMVSVLISYGADPHALNDLLARISPGLSHDQWQHFPVAPVALPTAIEH